MRKIEDYQKEYDTIKTEYDKLSKKLTRIRNKITKLRVSEENEFVETITFDNIEGINDEQWAWLLYHWHDETSYAYGIRTKFLYSLGLDTNGFAGHSHIGDIRQFNFTLHGHHKVDLFFEKFKLVKPHLKSFPSEIDETTVVDVQLFVNVYGWDWEYDGIYLEIDPLKHIGRFVRHNVDYDNKSDWLSVENCILKIKEYQINY